MHTRATLLETLAELGIEAATVDHPAVYTVEEAKQHRAGRGGGHSKNLFLRDKKGRMFLVTAHEDRKVDLKALRVPLGVKSLSFASAERLQRYLGVSPGSVTPFAAINDTDGLVTVVLDRGLLAYETLNFHPLENTATTNVSPDGLIRFFDAIGHPPLLLDL